MEDVEQFTVEVVATGGQERVDVEAVNITITDDDCEKISVFTLSTITLYLSLQLWKLGFH